MSASNDPRRLIARRPARMGAEQSVELWLRGELTAAYDATLAERLPDEWLALVDAAPLA